LTWFRAHLGVSWSIVGVSLLATVLGLVALRFLVVYLPADYFIRDRSIKTLNSRRSVGGWLWLNLKNLAGLVLLVIGLTMLLAPGPGVLMILFGLSLLDIPGKRALELKIIRNPRVLSGINLARAKAGRPPLAV
jgi:hypothetical protein